MTEIKRLIEQAKREREFHRSRGKNGQIETLASNIRIRALQDALACVEAEHG